MSEDETLIDFRGIKIVPEEARLIKEIEDDVKRQFIIHSWKSKKNANFYIQNGHVIEIYISKKKKNERYTNLFNFFYIKKIKLFDIIIPKIPYDAGKLVYLQTLVLSGINILSIEADFNQLNSLKELYISQGILNRIPMLPPQLEEVGLVNLGLNSFPIELKECKNLKKINLSENYINEVPEWLSEFHCLSFLNIKNNILAKLCNLSRMESLYYLDLGGNKLREFPLGLTKLKMLKDIFLQAQGFPRVPDIFANKHDLKYLHLNGFDLNDFPNSIAKCKELKVLNLDHCKMESSKPQLNGLRKLRKVSLVGCNLKTISDEFFITKEEIDIRNNQIEKMPDKWLQYADRLITDETTWKNPKRPMNLSNDDYLIMLAAMKDIVELDGDRLMGRSLGRFEEEFSIEFSDENILAEGKDLVFPDELMGLQHLPDGRPFIGLHVGGDWEYPVYVVVFTINDEINVIVPESSNTYNHLNDCAYGNDDEMDNKALDEIIKKSGKMELLNKPLKKKFRILDYSVNVDLILQEIKSYMD